jgi:hypothetical protein
MEIESLSCNNCGAPLDVPLPASFITCGYCGSPLSIRRTEGIHYTLMLEQLEEHTADLTRRAEYLRLRDELETVDTEWVRERKQYLTRRLSGTLQAPTRSYLVRSIGMAVVACVLTTWWFFATANAGSGASFFGWIGAVFSVIAIANATRITTNANNYNIARQEYQQQRKELLNGMHAAHSSKVPHVEQSPTMGR